MHSWLLSIAIAAAAGAIGGVAYERLSTPPQRFVIVDIEEMLKPLATDPALDDSERNVRAKLIAEAITKSADELVQQGFIVLDGSAVLRAPKDIYVEP